MVFIPRQGEPRLQISQFPIDSCGDIPLPTVALEQLPIVPLTSPHDWSVNENLMVDIGLKDPLDDLIL